MKIKNDVLELLMKMKPEDRPYIRKDHHLKTRRDFLSQGFVASAAFTMGPSLYTLLKSDMAMAAEGCTSSSGNAQRKAPVLIIDAAGGAKLAGNHMIVGGRGGQEDLLDTYRSMGLTEELNPNNPGMINRDFGVAMHSTSSVLQGMLDETAGNTAVRAKLDGGFFCAQSENDRSSNPLNPLYFLIGAGASGELAMGAGSQGNSNSGGRSVALASSVDPTVSPVQLRRTADLTGLINLGVVQDRFGNNGVDKAHKILKRIENLSASKIRNLSNKSLPEQLKVVSECGFDTRRYTEGTFTPEGLTPTNDTIITGIYTGNNNDLGSRGTNYDPNPESTEAVIVKGLLDGAIGVGTIVLGGHDYHNTARQTADRRDYRIGSIIGRAVTAAAAKASDLMIIVISDGSTGVGNTLDMTDSGFQKFRFTGDQSSGAGAMMFAYRHNATNSNDIMRSDGNGGLKRQVGAFTMGDRASIDRNDGSLIQATTQNVAGNLAAVFAANYLAFHGEESRFLSVVGDGFQNIQNDLERYLIFKAA